MNIISIASDHTGYKLKLELKFYLKDLGYTIIDRGCNVKQKTVDYPDYAIKVVKDIIKKKSNYGILICNTGLGMSTVANRFNGIYAALCNNVEIAKLAREHGNANILCIGEGFTTNILAKDIVKIFLETEFSKEIRHRKRLDKLASIAFYKYNNFDKKEENEEFDYTKILHKWWDKNGKFRTLHMINSVRVEYIINIIKKLKKCELNEISLLDIGCGGGILSESMARFGIKVTGIDICEENIKVARLHSKKNKLNIEYINTSIEEIESNEKYDIILLMEVVEHVENVELFIKKAIELLKPNGIVFISTINRTIKSFLFAIIGAEYILRWLPKGTHKWNKFLKPSEIANYMIKNNVDLKDMSGINFNIIKRKWNITKATDVNYILYGILN